MIAVQMDKMRSFKFGMRGISHIEKKLGNPIGKIDFNNLSMEEMAVVIQGGLVHEDKEIGLKTADEIMDIIDQNDNLEEVMAAMSEAMKEMRAKKSTKK